MTTVINCRGRYRYGHGHNHNGDDDDNYSDVFGNNSDYGDDNSDNIDNSDNSDNSDMKCNHDVKCEDRVYNLCLELYNMREGSDITCIMGRITRVVDTFGCTLVPSHYLQKEIGSRCGVLYS